MQSHKSQHEPQTIVNNKQKSTQILTSFDFKIFITKPNLNEIKKKYSVHHFKFTPITIGRLICLFLGGSQKKTT